MSFSKLLPTSQGIEVMVVCVCFLINHLWISDNSLNELLFSHRLMSTGYLSWQTGLKYYLSYLNWTRPIVTYYRTSLVLFKKKEYKKPFVSKAEFWLGLDRWISNLCISTWRCGSVSRIIVLAVSVHWELLLFI